MKPTLNVVLVRRNGMAVTFTTTGWKRFAEMVLDEVESSKKLGWPPIEQVFVSAGERLERHKVEDLRADLAAGRIPD
jgi:hypothetical protein